MLGISAAWSDGPIDGGVAQPVKTVVWTVLGFSLMVLAASVDYHWLRTFDPDLPVHPGAADRQPRGRDGDLGAQLSVTIAGLDFQFSEIAKVLMVVVLAAFLARARRAGGRAIDHLRRRTSHRAAHRPRPSPA